VSAVFVLALLIQGVAGLTFRGLYADGAPFVTHIMENQSFTIFAPSRWMSNAIAEVPVVSAIKLGIASPQLAALIFSVTTNVLPGVIFLLSAAALPPVERQFFVFPAFVYFAGTLATQFASVTEGLVAIPYVWLVLYLILFGQLSALRFSLILLLSVGCLRLHEAMSFLGPLLFAAVWLRWRDATLTSLAQFAFGLILLAILASATVGTYWVLFPYAPEERALFISQSLQQQWWLYVPGTGCNLPAVLGLLAGISIIACIAVPNIARVSVVSFGIIATVLAVAAFWADALTVPAAQFYARHNAAFMSFPLMILVLVARFVRGTANRLTAPPVQKIVMILGVTVSLWHIQATEKWSTFFSHFRTVLDLNSGILPSDMLLRPPGTRPAHLAAKMIWSWTNPDLSILALPRRCITSIIANPQPLNWYYNLQDPTTLPRIPGLAYTYLLPPDRQGAACPPS
jgi:hypothetical protein